MTEEEILWVLESYLIGSGLPPKVMFIWLPTSLAKTPKEALVAFKRDCPFPIPCKVHWVVRRATPAEASEL